MAMDALSYLKNRKYKTIEEYIDALKYGEPSFQPEKEQTNGNRNPA